MHKVFISYHHRLDKEYRKELSRINENNRIFIDRSVDFNGLDKNLSDYEILRLIRDNFLQDSTVTVVLVGAGSYGRQHIDWQIGASMVDGTNNQKSGVIAVNLPVTRNDAYFVSSEKSELSGFQNELNPEDYKDKSLLEKQFPHLPRRLMDNVFAAGSLVSIVPWKMFKNPKIMKSLISAAHENRNRFQCDLGRPLMRRNTWHCYPEEVGWI